VSKQSVRFRVDEALGGFSIPVIYSELVPEGTI